MERKGTIKMIDSYKINLCKMIGCILIMISGGTMLPHNHPYIAILYFILGICFMVIAQKNSKKTTYINNQHKTK